MVDTLDVHRGRSELFPTTSYNNTDTIKSKLTSRPSLFSSEGWVQVLRNNDCRLLSDQQRSGVRVLKKKRSTPSNMTVHST